MKHAFTFLMMLGAVSSLPAVENASAAAFEPPKKYGAERYMAGWERNPFAIPTPPTPPAAVESQFKDLAIKSVYGPKDSPVFSLVNTKTHERLRLSMGNPKDGIELKSFHLADNRKETTIEVAKGTETATLKYATDYVPPAANAQGRPGAVPGMPGAPGMPGTAGRIPIPQVGTAAGQPNRTPIAAGTPASQRTVPGATSNPNAAAAAASAAEATARRRLVTVPPATGAAAAGTAPTINLSMPGTNSASPIITPATTNPATGDITPPIVRPPPSIYLDGSR
jgi:hypothetical protein